MRKIICILVALVGLNNISAKACDCIYFGGFAYSNQFADLVVYGRVVKYDKIGTYGSSTNPYSIKFEIIECLRGVEKRDTISVFGDYGADCRPYISIFKPNTEWILAVNRYNNDYGISNCGEFYMKVKNSIVKGNVYGKGRNKTIKYICLSELRYVINNPQLYPVYSEVGVVKIDRFGNEYLTYCDHLPECSLSNEKINEIVNENINIPKGDSYLLHACIIVNINNQAKFNGIFQTNRYPYKDYVELEKRLEVLMNKIQNWKCGYNLGKPVTAQVIIPILIKK